MHRRYQTARGCRRPAFATTLGLVTLAWVGAASARCGDAPGDAAAVAAVRTAVEMQCPCAGAVDRGSYMRCAKGVIEDAKNRGILPPACASSVKRRAKEWNFGLRSSVTCLLTNASGRTRWSGEEVGT